MYHRKTLKIDIISLMKIIIVPHYENIHFTLLKLFFNFVSLLQLVILHVCRLKFNLNSKVY